MITGFFINIITTVVTFFIEILPIYQIPQEGLDAITLIVNYMNALSFLFPIGTLFTVLGLAVFYHSVIFIWNFSLKLYHMIKK